MAVKVVFNRRLCWLLFLLSETDAYQSLKNLGNRMHSTRRSVEYDLARLNRMFDELNLDKITAIPSKGILLTEKNKQWFKEITADFQGRITYVYSQQERIAYCLSLIIIGGHSYNIETLATLLNVSRSTIFKDIHAVHDLVLAHNGQLSYDRFSKYYISATGKDYIKLLRIAADIMFAAVPPEILKYILNKDVIEMMTRISRLRSDDSELQANLNTIIEKHTEQGGEMVR